MARQKVRPAMELVSSSVALAIERHLGRPEEVRALRVFDSGMDVLNAIHPGDVKPLRRGYRGSPEQEAALTALEDEAKAMRVGRRTEHSALLTFQKGIVICVSSARGLLRDMQEKFGEATYLLTRHLTQDRLEGFFGMVRGSGGGSVNPTPTEVRARLRLLTLLFAIQRGVRPLQRDETPAASAAAEANGATSEEQAEVEQAEVAQAEVEQAEVEQTEVEALEEETVATMDGEVAEDLCEVMSQPSGVEELVEEADDGEQEEDEEELADLMELLESASDGGIGRPAESTSGACDLETGVPASDSAMAYVAGYVARKRPPDDSPDDSPDAEVPEEPLETLWTRLRSHGGLTVPTAEFLATFRQMDAAFCIHHALHPDGLSRRPGVLRDFMDVLEAKFGALVTYRVRRTFARVRTFIRLRHVNALRRSRARSNACRETRKRRQYVVR